MKNKIWLVKHYLISLWALCLSCGLGLFSPLDAFCGENKFRLYPHDTQVESLLTLRGENVTGLRGTLYVLAATFKDGKTSQTNQSYWYELEDESGIRHPLYFSKEPEGLPATGSRIQIFGAVQYLNKLAGQYPIVVNNSEFHHGFQILEEVKPLGVGPISSAFILVNFRTDPNYKPHSIAQVQASINDVKNHWFDASFGQVPLSGTAFDNLTLNIDPTCDFGTIMNAGSAAVSAAGLDLSRFWGRVYIVSGANCGGLLGLGWVGAPGALVFVNDSWVKIHEMGHNLGLWHANGLFCGGSSPIGNACSNDEYADPSDAMGISTAFYNAFHKEQLGWLNANASPPITTVTSSSRLLLDVYETQNKNAKALKILKTNHSDGSQDYYYIEYRQPIGMDAGMPANFFQGILIHQGNNRNTNSSHLLDMTPQDHNYSNAALLPGMTFSDPNAPNGGVKIELKSVSSAGADVVVSFGNKPICTSANPTLSIAPTQIQWIKAGSPAIFALTLTNNDSPGCEPADFNLTQDSESAITATFQAASVKIAPGASTSVALTLKPMATAGTWPYTTKITAQNSANPTLAAKGEATIGVLAYDCVNTVPSISLAPSTLSTLAGEKLSYTATIANNDKDPNCLASTFELSLTLPTGFTSEVSQKWVSISPGAKANVIVSLASEASLPLGTYPFTLTATHTALSQLKKSTNATYIIAQALPAFLRMNRTVFIRDPKFAQTAEFFIAASQSSIVSGAAVLVKILTPSGKTVTSNGSTNIFGNFTMTYPILPTSEVGTYKVEVQVTKSNIYRTNGIFQIK